MELSNKADNEFMEKLLKLIETNIDNPELNIQMMCSELAMSRTLLYNKITQLTGKSPTEFIRIFRLKQAAALLLSGEYSVTDVALRWELTIRNTLVVFSRNFMVYLPKSIWQKENK